MDTITANKVLNYLLQSKQQSVRVDNTLITVNDCKRELINNWRKDEEKRAN